MMLSQSFMALTSSPKEVMIKKRANDVASKGKMIYSVSYTKMSTGRTPRQ